MKRVPLLAIATSLLSPARIDAQARFETIYEFASLPDGSAPQGLAEGPKGGHRAQRRRRHLWSHHIWRILGPRHCLRPRLYGMTAYGGSANYGTVFQLTPPASHAGRWSESILFEFTNPNYGGGGTNPFSAPVVGKDGSIYGATGGISVIFQLQPPATTGGTWTETVLYPTSEDYPAAGFTHGLIVGPNGELYAAASVGGYYGCGAVVGLTPPSVSGKWSVSMEYDFPGGNTGCKPAGIALSADGVIYGVTTYGGSSGQGIVFALASTA